MTTLLQMSLRGAAVIAAVILLRALLLDRLPKRTFLALWTVAILTLLLPWRLPSPTSVWGLLRVAAEEKALPPGTSPRYTEQAPDAGISDDLPGAAAQPGPAAREEATPQSAGPRRTGPVRILPRAYLAGAGLLLGFFLAAWLRFRRRFRRSVPADNALTRDYVASAKLRRRVRVRESEAISSPLTCGVLRPMILFLRPTVWERSETLDLVFAHELQHIRRFDAVKKGMLILTLAVHWFNPLVWAMFVLANRDIELACDEAVLRRLGREKRRAYALTLLEMEEKRSGLSALMSGMAQNAVKQRVRSVMNMKQKGIISIVLALVLVVGVYAVFATGALAEEPEAAEQPAAQTIVAEAPAAEETPDAELPAAEENPAAAPDAAPLPAAAEEPARQGRTEPFVTEWQTQEGESATSSTGPVDGWGESSSGCASFGLNEGTEVTLEVEGSGARWIQVSLVDYWTGKTAARTEQIMVSGDFRKTLTLTAPYTEYFTVRLQASTGRSYHVKTVCSAEAATEGLSMEESLGGYDYQSRVIPFVMPEGGRYDTRWRAADEVEPSHAASTNEGVGGAAGGAGSLGGLNEGDVIRFHVWGDMPGKLEVGLFNIDTRELSFERYAPYGEMDETAELTVPSTGRYQFYLVRYDLQGDTSLDYTLEGEVFEMKIGNPAGGRLDRIGELVEEGEIPARPLPGGSVSGSRTVRFPMN